MACTDFLVGTLTLSAADQIISISGLTFTPNNLLIGIAPTSTSTAGEYGTFSISANETNSYRRTYGSEDGMEINAITYTISFGTTTKLTQLNANYWDKGTYRYVLWREE